LQRVVHAASEAVSDVAAIGREAVAGARDVEHLLTEAIDESLEKRPYATLAIAFALGFVLARLR
jgi:phosphate uptake regulator